MPPEPATQPAFRAAIFDGAPPADVTAPDPSEVDRRFAVYRNNVAHSLVEALRRRFPVIERLVGAEFASAMFGAFVRAHPPRSPLMMEYGDRMPGFLETFPPVAGLPYLADMARLELARGVAYHAADAEPLDRTALADAAGRAPETLRLRLHPSVQVLTSSHPVHRIWSMNQPGATPRPLADAGAESVLIARSGLTVLTLPLTAPAARFLTVLLAGGSLAEAGAAAGPDFDPSEDLARLIGAGLIVDVDRPTEEQDP